MRRPVALALYLLAGWLGSACAQAGDPPEFDAWLADFRQEALAQGIRPATLEAALGNARPLPRVKELDARQPEFVNTFWNYLDARVNPRQVKLGKDKLWVHRKVLNPIQRRQGVPASLLVALWGLETKFGRQLGGFPIPSALATLAHDGRRAGFFREELMNALRILQQGHVAVADMKGSWAGAMGQMQFMPTTFLNHAVDADGDGRTDIWRSLPDALESGAQYLKRLGWRKDELWGREVRLPAGFDFGLAQIGSKKPVSEWAALGVTAADGKQLPKSDLAGALLLPQGHAGPAFLVYRNFDVVMAWNRSVNYALSVLLFADQLQGLPPPRLGREADNRPMSRDQLIEMQRLLRARGFETGDADGVPGSRTREAIRAFQQSAGLPVDGFASATLLEQLVAGSQPQARVRSGGATEAPAPN
jgi:membrane-bound lytic murein transglycosylase B